MANLYGYVNKFGRIPDMDSADTDEDVWDGEGAYPFLAAATELTISSSSTDDDAAGTGALTIRVYYLDSSWVEQTADITMNGQSAASTTITAWRVYRAYVLTAGTGSVNAGNIWVGSGSLTAGVPANKYAGILANRGQTLMAIYTIPLQATGGGKIYRWYVSSSASIVSYGTVALETREFGAAWRTRRIQGIGPSSFISETTSISVASKADIRVRVLTISADNSSISAGFDIELLS